MSDIKYCSHCGEELDSDEIESPYYERDEEENDNTIMCESCYQDYYQIPCIICQSFIDDPEKPEDYIFVISKETIEEFELYMKPGVYQVLKFPFYYRNILTGFEGFENESLKLLKELDINNLFNRTEEDDNLIEAGIVCEICLDEILKSN